MSTNISPPALVAGGPAGAAAWCLITRCRPAICLLRGQPPQTPHKSKANGDQIIVPLRAEMAGKSIEGANWWIKQEI